MELKIGFQSSRYNNLTLLEELNFTIENNLKIFDIFFDGFLPKDISAKELRKILNLVSEDFVFTVHFPIFDYSKYPKFLDGLIDFCISIKIKIATIHFDRLSFKILEKILKKIDNKFKISIENTIPDKNFIYNLNYIDFMKKINYNSVYSTFDVGHANITQNNLIEYLNIFKTDNISSFHIHDNSGNKDNHLNIGAGNIDFPSILSIIKEKFYDSILIIEHWDNNRLTFKELEDNYEKSFC
jgi:sugar phosphate isomerase/epimerase